MDCGGIEEKGDEMRRYVQFVIFIAIFICRYSFVYIRCNFLPYFLLHVNKYWWDDKPKLVHPCQLYVTFVWTLGKINTKQLKAKLSKKIIWKSHATLSIHFHTFKKQVTLVTDMSLPNFWDFLPKLGPTGIIWDKRVTF